MRQSMPRLRHGIGISLEEYCSRNIDMVRNFQAEALTLSGYIGYFDAMNTTLRVFIFDDKDEADRAVKVAHSLGFESAGPIEGFVIISNDRLRRPHLKKIASKSRYYKELYR